MAPTSSGTPATADTPEQPPPEQGLDHILAKELPTAARQFLQEYKGVARQHAGEQVVELGPARQLRKVLEHLRDVSWRKEMAEAQAAKLEGLLSKAMPPVQAAVAAVGELEDLKGALAASASPAALVSFALLALEASAIYCALAGTFAAPASLIAEDLGVAVVRCVRQCLRHFAAPILSPAEARGAGGAAGAAAAGGAPAGASPFTAEAAIEVLAGVASVFKGLHEYLCRYRLGDDQLHQLVYCSLGVFFSQEPHFPICAAAEELLVTIFARHQPLRGSVLQEFLVKAPKLPCGRRARRFLQPVAKDNPDFGLSPWTRLLIKLVQCTCLPLHEQPGAEVEFAAVLDQHATSAQPVLSQLASGLLQRLVLTRTKDEESRALLEEMIEELLTAAFKPPWPGALALVRAFVRLLIPLVQPEKKTPGEASVREYGLKLLSKILTTLWHQNKEALGSKVVLPPWTSRPTEETKEARLLQRVALRVALNEGVELPWLEAARAEKAWDAEVFLAEGDESSGLALLTEDIVFMYLTMAHLDGERAAGARLPPVRGAAPALSAAVFPAGHPVHAWTFMVCEWAEAASKLQQHHKEEATEEGAEPKRRRLTSKVSCSAYPDGHQAVLERFLAGAWTSRAPIGAEGPNGRGVGGRALTAFPVYKCYRQLRCAELVGLRRAALDCILKMANSAQASLRKSAVRALSDLVESDVTLLRQRLVEETIDMRLRDESSWVRQVALDLLGRVLERSLEEGEAKQRKDDGGARSAEGRPKRALGADGPGVDVPAPIMLDQGAKTSATASAMLLRFHQTVRGRINDTSVMVRRQASRILSAFVLNHPEHPDVVDVAHALMRRSTDSDALRNFVLNTFELLWFMDEEPSPRAALQLALVVDAAGTMSMGPAVILGELLKRFKQNISSRKRSKGYDFAVRRWTTLLLNEFVQPTRLPTAAAAAPAGGKKSAGSNAAQQDSKEEVWKHRRALLSALEAFAHAQPEAMLNHLRPLSVYLAVEDGSPGEDQWIAQRVCRILSTVLPLAAGRGLLDHKQVQQDLQALIRTQPSTGVREAVLCLCQMVKYVTGDLHQLVFHLNAGVPALAQLLAQFEAKQAAVDRIHALYMSRQVWVLAAVFEGLSVDEYLLPTGADPALAEPKQILPRERLKFDFVGGSAAATVADILVRMYSLNDMSLHAVAVSCLGFFLRGQRGFVKDRRIKDIFTSALASSDPMLCLRALEALASLLVYFAQEADVETRAGRAMEVQRVHGLTAVEAAQPLSSHCDAVLGHLTLAGGVSPAHTAGKEEASAEGIKIRVEALAVVRSLHQQGLVNPMAVLPKVFALGFSGEPALAEPATGMLKAMLELRPTTLLNRIDEAFQEAFLALHATGHPARIGASLSVPQLSGIGELYADRFRKQKAIREAFLRKAIKELSRQPTGHFVERFTELSAGAPGAGGSGSAARDSSASAKGRLADPLHGVPQIPRYQLLYTQFMLATICALPFLFESEPLLVVYECNNLLSLQAGAFLVGADRGKASAPADMFALSVSIVACYVLKNAVKAAYSLSDEQCATFNPKDVKQERLKWLPTAAGGHRFAATACTDEGAVATVRPVFPADEWSRLAGPLAEHFATPSEIAAHVRALAEEDPYDSSRIRHAKVLERLEGRPTVTPAKGRQPAGQRGRGAAAGRGRASGRGRTAAAPAKRAAARQWGQPEDEDEDWEEDGRGEEAEEEDAEGAEDEEVVVEVLERAGRR